MERLTERSKNSDMVWFKDVGDSGMLLEPCEMESRHSRMAITKLATYEDADEKGMILPAPLDGVESFSLDGKTTWFKAPCKVGDVAYLIDRDEDNKLKVYEGKMGTCVPCSNLEGWFI